MLTYLSIYQGATEVQDCVCTKFEKSAIYGL